MKNNNRQILLFAVIIILLCFFVVLVFTLPSFIKQLDLSRDSTSNIGSAIGGLTAPIIGIVSSVLLYLALTRQTESNIDQRLKNESDIIFLLLNQLDQEISSFYYSFTQTKGEQKKEFNYTGIQAFHIFVQALNKDFALSNFRHTFNSFYQAKQILLVLRSFTLIEKRVELSELSSELKEMFLHKLNSVYECRLKESLTMLDEIIDKNPHTKDFSTDEIKSFLKLHN